MKILLLIVVAIAGALLLRSRPAKSSSSAGANERLMTADEAPPTETGRLRIADIVKSIKTDSDAKGGESPAAAGGPAEELAEFAEENAERLPDPFSSGKQSS